MGSARRSQEPLSFKERMVESVWKQGPITAAFFLIVFVVGYRFDSIVMRFESGYDRNARALLEVTKEHTKAIESVLMQWREDRKLLIDALKSDREALEKAGVIERRETLQEQLSQLRPP